MAYTYSKIASVTVGSGGSLSMDFLAIPQNYTDLLLNVSVRTNQSYLSIKYDDMSIKINNSSINGTNKNVEENSYLNASPRILAGSYICYFHCPTISNTANTFGNANIYIPNYTGSNYKSISVDYTNEDNSSFTALGLGAGLWSQTSPVTSLSIYSLNACTILQYSTATLYGIKAEV